MKLSLLSYLILPSSVYLHTRFQGGSVALLCILNVAILSFHTQQIKQFKPIRSILHTFYFSQCILSGCKSLFATKQ